MTVNSVGSGLGSSVGTGVESTYGTPATPTRWLSMDSHEIKLNPQFVQGNGLRQGSLVNDQFERVWSAADVGGSAVMNFARKGMGQLIGSLMGSLTTNPVQQSSSIAYLQTHALSTNYGQSLTIQEGIPDITGVVHNWTTQGAKVVQGDFECEVGELLKSSFTIDAQDRLENGADITAVSLLTSNQVFGFPNMIVKVGTFGSEVQVDGISKWSSSIKRSQADKRFNAGNITTAAAGYAVKDQPVDNGFFNITGTLETEFIDTTKFVDIFMSQGNFSLIVTFTGPVIASAFHWNVTFNFPCCRYTGTDPTVNGPDLVKPAMPFIVLNDETHVPATITITSTDTAL